MAAGLLLRWVAFAAVAVALYFLSSGLSYVAMYVVGRGFPSRLASRVYAPLEWLARHSSAFNGMYHAFLQWCYRRFAAGRDYNTRNLRAYNSVLSTLSVYESKKISADAAAKVLVDYVIKTQLPLNVPLDEALRMAFTEEMRLRGRPQ